MLDLSTLGKKRVCLVKQTQITECGLASLAMISSYYGQRADIASLRKLFNPSLRGVTMRVLIKQAAKIGLNGRAVQASLASLRGLRLPAILHWDFNHFVVLEEIKNNRYLIHDPATNSRWFTEEELSPHYTGVAAELSPPFKRAKLIQPLNFKPWDIMASITNIGSLATKAIILSVLLQIHVLASPLFLQVAVDTIIPSLDTELLVTLLIGFGLFAIFNAIATFLRASIMLNVGALVGFTLSAELGRRLLHLPIDWFEKRHTGDILSRFQSIMPINQALTEGAMIIIIDGVLAITTLLFMLYYSLALTAVTVVAAVLYFLAKLIFLKFERRATDDSIVDNALEQSEIIANIEGIHTLRAFNSEPERNAIWLNKLADSFNSNIRLQRLQNAQNAIYTLIFALENTVIVYVAIRSIIAGDGFSLGMLFALLAFKANFLNSAARLADQIVAFRMLRLHVERLTDILGQDEDQSFEIADIEDRDFQTAIKFKSVFARYSEFDKFVLANASFEIRKGENVAITGSSGSGKTTIIKLLQGWLEPEKGEIFVDGQLLKNFGVRNLQRQTGLVIQDGGFFHGSIADSIGLFDDELDMNRIEWAAGLAGIHDEVTAMPMRFHTPVGKLGSALSGGQRQRILIARALYKRPALLIMDEATSSLDYLKERQIIESMRSLDMTRITLAHRIDTILSADRILSVEAGRIIEVSPEKIKRDYLANFSEFGAE